MGQLKLTVNEEKTRICKVPEETIDFLGYAFGRLYSLRTGRPYLGMLPSTKSVRHLVDKIHALTTLRTSWQETKQLVGKLNRALRAWGHHFQRGAPGRAYRALDCYTATRLRRWLHIKHKVRRCKGGSYPLPTLYGRYGLVRLTRFGHDVVRVNA
jgi:RNA-directed DNA polymerase